MGEEAISVPVEHAAESVGEPIQMDDVQPEMKTDPPLKPKPLVLESVAQTKEAAATSLGLKPKAFTTKIHCSTDSHWYCTVRGAVNERFKFRA